MTDSFNKLSLDTLGISHHTHEKITLEPALIPSNASPRSEINGTEEGCPGRQPIRGFVLSLSLMHD